MLLYLKESRGFDFTGYKRTSLARRVRRRMAQVGTDHYGEYIDHLQVNAEEFGALFNTILINVTSFFRDAGAWEFLRSELVPGLLAERSPEEQIRVWSAGCASGEEALTQARRATYPQSAVEHLPPDMVADYFERQGSRCTFRKDLRRSVIFGRNDLVQDARSPASNCRCAATP